MYMYSRVRQPTSHSTVRLKKSMPLDINCHIQRENSATFLDFRISHGSAERGVCKG